MDYWWEDIPSWRVYQSYHFRGSYKRRDDGQIRVRDSLYFNVTCWGLTIQYIYLPYSVRPALLQTPQLTQWSLLEGLILGMAILLKGITLTATWRILLLSKKKDGTTDVGHTKKVEHR